MKTLIEYINESANPTFKGVFKLAEQIYGFCQNMKTGEIVTIKDNQISGIRDLFFKEIQIGCIDHKTGKYPWPEYSDMEFPKGSSAVYIKNTTDWWNISEQKFEIVRIAITDIMFKERDEKLKKEHICSILSHELSHAYVDYKQFSGKSETQIDAQIRKTKTGAKKYDDIIFASNNGSSEIYRMVADARYFYLPDEVSAYETEIIRSIKSIDAKKFSSMTDADIVNELKKYTAYWDYSVLWKKLCGDEMKSLQAYGAAGCARTDIKKLDAAFRKITNKIYAVIQERRKRLPYDETKIQKR